MMSIDPKVIVLGATLLATIALNGCGATAPGSFAASVAGASEPTQMGAVTTVNGVEQFDVPPDGRSILSQRLQQLVGEPIQSAKISNAWRTSASAQATPNDYAACVNATTASGSRTYMIVKSGAGTGDVKDKSAAAAVCADQARVVHWTTLPEAMAGAAE